MTEADSIPELFPLILKGEDMERRAQVAFQTPAFGAIHAKLCLLMNEVKVERRKHWRKRRKEKVFHAELCLLMKGKDMVRQLGLRQRD